MNRARRAIVAIVAGALAIAGTTALGFWQLRRATAKEVLQRQIDDAARAAPSVPGGDALAHPDKLLHTHIALRGRWMRDGVVYLDNRPNAGRAGFYVLMPLRVEAPAGADVIINRGWLPRDASDRTRLAPYRTPADVVTVAGVALADEPNLLELAPQRDRRLGGLWQNFDFDAYARASGRAPVRIVVRQDGSPGASPSAEADGLDRNWPDRGSTLQAQIDRHHGYAFQWFALAATLAGLLIYQLIRVTKHDRKHPA